MTYRAVVKNGVVELPPEAGISDGMEMDVSVRLHGTKLEHLLKHAGAWQGDDADEVLELIYKSRSSRETPSLD
jgi:hypothetical protein